MSLFHKIEEETEKKLIPVPYGKLIIGETLMLQIVGGTMPSPEKPEVHPHRHNEEQLAWLLEGECELEIETAHPPANYTSLPDQFIGQPSERRRIKAGDFFRIPSGALHSLSVIGDKRCTWLSVYHPVRQEYLKTRDVIKLESKEKPLWFRGKQREN